MNPNTSPLLGRILQQKGKEGKRVNIVGITHMPLSQVPKAAVPAEDDEAPEAVPEPAQVNQQLANPLLFQCCSGQ